MTLTADGAFFETPAQWTIEEFEQAGDDIRAALEVDDVAVYLMEPGNGARYGLVIARMPGGTGQYFGVGHDPAVLVSLANWNAAYVFAERPGFRHWTYVKEKLGGPFGMGDADAKVVANLLNAFFGVG